MELWHVMSNDTIDEIPDVRKGICEDLTLFPPNMSEMRRKKTIDAARARSAL